MLTQIEKEDIWKQYQIDIDMYKHYMDMMLKFNISFYAITGAIISFYFSRKDIPMIKYSLLFPIIMSILYAVYFGYCIPLTENSRQHIFDLCKKLEFSYGQEFNVLKVWLYIMVIQFTLVAITLLFLFLN